MGLFQSKDLAADTRERGPMILEQLYQGRNSSEAGRCKAHNCSLQLPLFWRVKEEPELVSEV